MFWLFQQLSIIVELIERHHYERCDLCLLKRLLLLSQLVQTRTLREAIASLDDFLNLRLLYSAVHMESKHKIRRLRCMCSWFGLFFFVLRSHCFFCCRIWLKSLSSKHPFVAAIKTFPLVKSPMIYPFSPFLMAWSSSFVLRGCLHSAMECITNVLPGGGEASSHRPWRQPASTQVCWQADGQNDLSIPVTTCRWRMGVCCFTTTKGWIGVGTTARDPPSMASPAIDGSLALAEVAVLHAWCPGFIHASLSFGCCSNEPNWINQLFS